MRQTTFGSALYKGLFFGLAAIAALAPPAWAYVNGGDYYSIRQAVATKEQSVKQGQAGPLQYQVGTFAFESYWETN